MTFNEAVNLAYEHSLCVDFYSCTITDTDGNEWYWYWYGDVGKESFIDTLKDVVEFRLNYCGE